MAATSPPLPARAPMEACNCFAPVGRPPASFLPPGTVLGALRRRRATFAGDLGSCSATAVTSSRSKPILPTVLRAGAGGITSTGDPTPTKAERAGVAPAEKSSAVLEELRREAEDALEWKSLCSGVAAFASTSMGREVCAGGGLPVGRDRGESQELLDQTAAAVLLPRPLDFSGVEDVSRIVASAVSGEVLSIRELCAVQRSLRASRGVYEQMMVISAADGCPSHRIKSALAPDLLRKQARMRELLTVLLCRHQRTPSTCAACVWKRHLITSIWPFLLASLLVFSSLFTGWALELLKSVYFGSLEIILALQNLTRRAPRIMDVQ